MDDNRLLEQIAEMLQMHMEAMEKKIHNEIQTMKMEISIQIENDVTKRIESLFDGYKLVHEKQWDLERRCDKLEQRLAELEKKVS